MLNSDHSGIPVYIVLEGSIADKAGIKGGDVIIAINGDATPTYEEYIAVRQKHGTTQVFTVWRKSENKVLELKAIYEERIEITSDGSEESN